VSATLTLTDIPAGAWSDAFSRKWPLVAGHGFLAAGMIMTGAVTAFPLLVCTQVLWGLGWACSGGADVAWLTDEMARPERIDWVLAARARWELCGGAAGLVSFGIIGWAAGLPAAIVTSGGAMAALGLFVAARFSEDNFRPVRRHRWYVALSVLRNGLSLTRHDSQILLMLAATVAVNGAGMISWLFPRRLVELGLPGGVGRVLAGGVAFGVVRAVSVIWVNRRTASDTRATVHSFLSQAETVGEIAGGLALAAVAGSTGMPASFLAAAAVIDCIAIPVALVRG
jgi:hypothetical protein